MKFTFEGKPCRDFQLTQITGEQICVVIYLCLSYTALSQGCQGRALQRPQDGGHNRSLSTLMNMY